MRPILMTTTAILALSITVPAWAAEAADDQGDTAEIVVTAQKRDEKLKDIPVAASVLSSASIENNHVTDLSDINRVVPSVEIKGTFNGRVPYGLRGISTNANEGAIGLTSGVSIEIDGVPVPADSFAANGIADVAQLEVLKGPQATLGGRTASAGRINFVTNGPSDTFKGAMSAAVTDDGEYRGEARISGPLGEGVSFSLSGNGSHTPYPVENLTTKVKSYGDSYGVRAKLKIAPSSDFDATLMGHYNLAKSRGENFVPVYFTPGASVFPFIPYSFDANGVPTAYGIPQSVAFPGYTIGYGNAKYASPVDMGSRYEDIDGSLLLNYRSGGLTFSSLTAYFKENQFQSQDVFETNVYFFDVLTGGHAPHFNNTQSATGKVTQFTQEFKVASDPSLPVNFVAGLFYSDMKVDQTGVRAWVGNPIAKQNISDTKTYSAYGRVTAALSDQFKVVAGLRYNHDKIGWNVTQFFDFAKGYYQGGPFGPYPDNPSITFCGCNWALSDSSSALVGDIALQAKLSEEAMVYASYTRGYKPKVFNTVHDFVTLQSASAAIDAPFAKAAKQEHIDSFELGLKSSLLDRHLTLDLAAFYTKYNDYQAQIFDTSQIVGLLVLTNAGARTAGVEADLNYVQDNTRLSLSAAYIDAKFTSFKGANCYPTQTAAQGCVGGAQDLSGHSLPASPKFKLSASIQQTIPLEPFNLILGGNLSARSEANLQPDANPQARQPGFATIDLSLGFQTKDEKATLTFFVNNLTNHFYYTNMEDFFAGATGTAAVPSGAVTPGNYVIGQPARDARRYFGGRVNVKF